MSFVGTKGDSNTGYDGEATHSSQAVAREEAVTDKPQGASGTAVVT